jgi:hypothetical protein
MITLEKVQVFEKYLGDIEGWDRFGKEEDKEKLNYKEFLQIEGFIRDLGLIKENILSKSYEKKVLKAMEEETASYDIIEKLSSLIGKY